MSRSPLPKETEQHLRALDSLAQERRRALGQSIALLQRRLHPAHLKARAQNHLFDRALDSVTRARDTIRDNPVRTAGIAVLLGAIIARGPLLKLAARAAVFARDYFRRRSHNHGTSAKDEGDHE